MGNEQSLDTLESVERELVDENQAKTQRIQRYYDIDQDYTTVPIERACFYCCSEGKNHPIEYFTKYPCCGTLICRDCMWNHKGRGCGECLTIIPEGNVPALSWMRSLKPRTANCESRLGSSSMALICSWTNYLCCHFMRRRNLHHLPHCLLL